MSKNTSIIYSSNHSKFIDKLIVKKRLEMVKIINYQIKKYKIIDVLDIGTTIDKENESSNFIVIITHFFGSIYENRS